MEKDNGPFRWAAAHLRVGYQAYVRFMGAIYGGEPAAKTAEIETLERLYQNSPDRTDNTDTTGTPDTTKRAP